MLHKHGFGSVTFVMGLVGFTLSMATAADKEAAAPPRDGSPQQQIVSLAERASHLLQLRTCEVVAITPVAEVGGIVRVQLPLQDRAHTIQFAPHSDRALGFRVLAQGADGELRPADPGPVRTLRGFIVDEAGSVAAGALLDDGLHAVIRRADGSAWWVQPAPPELANAPDLHVVYRAEDVLPSANRCAMPDQQMAAALAPDGPAPAAARGAGGPCTALLACDTDVEYFQHYGSVANVVARISLIMNAVNVQYESEVNITHQLGTIIVRTAEPDPYTATASSGVVCNMITHWLANLSHIQRDVVQLFVGREIDENIIGQAADIGDICNDNQGCCNCGTYGSDGSYCMVQSDFSGVGSTPFAQCTDLSSHELGHLWGGQHCPCVAPAYTMNPFITGANVHSPVFSIPLITTYRDTRPCLEPCRGGNINDECASAVEIFEGVTPFDTAGATTDGLAHVPLCEYDGQTYNDVWFTFVPTCTTEYVFSACSSGYDTDMVVYQGTECLPGTSRVVACNDDGCSGQGTSLQSILQAMLVKGESYLVRLGGWQSPDYGYGSLSIVPDATLDSDGDGVLNCDDNCALVANAGQEDCDGDGIGDACSGEPDCNKNSLPDSCDIANGTSLDVNGNGVPDECEPPPPSCSADVTNDDIVNVNDLLMVINSWGACADPENCPADITGDDTVNVNDLLSVINNWGPCP